MKKVKNKKRVGKKKKKMERRIHSQREKQQLKTKERSKTGKKIDVFMTRQVHYPPYSTA